MTVGRITEVHRTNFVVKTEADELIATVRGNFHAEGDFPKVGDFVLLEVLDDGKAVIEEVVNRRSVIKRKAADSDEEQIIAANVDVIFVVLGLDGDYSINRLERYLLLAAQSGIEAVIVLNKADIADDLEQKIREVEAVAGDINVEVVSATNGENMAALRGYVAEGKTAVLLGSSGAGKSTITNWLLQADVQAVQATRSDDNKGRHTTTSRQLFALPSGGFIIDTPGMRVLGVIDNDDQKEAEVFNKIDEIAARCKFRNCDHEKSAGCAVLEALETGDLTERELDNYHKILREQDYQDSKDTSEAGRHYAHNQKRQQQKYAAIQKEKMSRRLR